MCCSALPTYWSRDVLMGWSRIYEGEILEPAAESLTPMSCVALFGSHCTARNGAYLNLYLSMEIVAGTCYFLP